MTVFVSAPQVTTDPRYTSEAHRAAADDENAPEGIKVKTWSLNKHIYPRSVEAKPCAWWQPSDNNQTDDGYYNGFKESVAFLKDFMAKEVRLNSLLGS